ncbi:MAG: radical SAM/Cys-rich protein [Planctomycetota bacterium]|jgi:radical SAM/Cys-rich protein
MQDGSQVHDKYGFLGTASTHGVGLRPRSVNVLQVNVTKLCNQACRHCHVDSSPERTEHLSAETAERIIEVIKSNPSIQTIDLTGGAPELNPQFEMLVRRTRALGRKVLVRHNLTVTFDGNPQTGESMSHLPGFFAEVGVEVVCSLPYYQEYFTDRQRGSGVFDKSIEGLKLLNRQGYGDPESGLILDLVYNPAGAFLPAPQAQLEADFKRELKEKFDIRFNNLFAITNMPIHRFRGDLDRHGNLEAYMAKLVGAFNPVAAESVMCRDMVSIAHDGSLYDCDFNQMLGMNVKSESGTPLTVFDFEPSEFMKRTIQFADHCFGCTAGAGSSCGGEVTESAQPS